MVTPALTLGASAAAARHHSRKSSLVRSLGQKGHARHRFIVTGHKIRRPQSQQLQRMAVSTVSALTEEERQTALQTTLGATTGSNTMNPHPWTKVRTFGSPTSIRFGNPKQKVLPLVVWSLALSLSHADNSVASTVNGSWRFFVFFFFFFLYCPISLSITLSLPNLQRFSFLDMNRHHLILVSIIRIHRAMPFPNASSLAISIKPGPSCHDRPCWRNKWIIIPNGSMCTMSWT